MLTYQAADLFSMMTLWTLDSAQNIIIQLGLFFGCIICAKRIVYEKTMSVGDFVLYLSYITQLYGPLNWFGNYYRVIQVSYKCVKLQEKFRGYGENARLISSSR